MVDPLGLASGLFPGTKLLNFGVPNAGIAYVEGQLVVLGANFMNLEAMRLQASERFNDFMLEQFVSAALGYLSVQTQIGLAGGGSSSSEKASETKSGENKGDQASGGGLMMAILKYGVNYIPSDGDQPALVQANLLVTYNGEIPEEFVEIEYLQSVYTNDPNPGKDQLSVDGHPSNKGIFYHQEGVDRLVVGSDVFKREGFSGKYKYFDFPTRPVSGVTGTLVWKAELSLVGIRADGRSKILETLTWGFTYKSRESMARGFKPSYTKSSFFNQFIINNSWMFQKK